MLARIRTALVFMVIIMSAAACQSDEVTPAPTPEHWQRVTFLASRLLPGFAINIPAEWNYQISETGLIVFNYPRILEVSDDGADLPEGSLVANLSMLAAADVQRIGARNAAGIIDFFVGTAAGNGDGPQYSSAEVIKVNGRDAAQSLVSIGSSDSLLLAMALNGHYLLGVIVTPKDGLSQQRDLLNRIFESIEIRLAQ